MFFVNKNSINIILEKEKPDKQSDSTLLGIVKVRQFTLLSVQ